MVKHSISTILVASLVSMIGTTLAATWRLPNDHHNLLKRDPSGIPADILSEGCAVKDVGYATPVTNRGIQLGECYVNARIANQLFCAFEPNDGNMTASREGGPYGMCSCWNKFPEASNLMSFANLNYACMAWTKKDKSVTPPTLPGSACIPFPLICPNTLKNCYSKNWFTSGGPATMLSFASTKPTCKMYWKSNKKPGTSNFMYCDHIQDACPVPTNLAIVQANYTCDTSKCVAYTGSLSILDDASRKAGKSAGGSANTTSPGTTAASKNGSTNILSAPTTGAVWSKNATQAGGGKSLLSSLFGGTSGSSATNPATAAKTSTGQQGGGETMLGSLFGQNSSPSASTPSRVTSTPASSKTSIGGSMLSNLFGKTPTTSTSASGGKAASSTPSNTTTATTTNPLSSFFKTLKGRAINKEVELAASHKIDEPHNRDVVSSEREKVDSRNQDVTLKSKAGDALDFGEHDLNESAVAWRSHHIKSIRRRWK